MGAKKEYLEFGIVVQIYLPFLDPVGSLVSTLLVSGLWVGCHTFSKCVNFECVGMLGC